MTLQVNEIFYSIQGESVFAGRPCVFVRLSGCNLRCAYCDTRYAYKGGEAMDIPEILEAVSGYGAPLVEVTGGEPLLQKESPALIQALLSCGYQVLLETNGSLNIGRVDRRCVKIVDIKCPSSGESEKNRLDNLNLLRPADQVKFVIGTDQDFAFAREMVRSRCARIPAGQILFSPVSGRLAPRQLADWILAEKLWQVRLQLQLHKHLWPDIEQGV